MALSRVTVFDNQISLLFAPGGEAWKEQTTIRRKIEEGAVFEAPKRTGDLARAHYSSQIKQGRFGALAYVGNSAEHAEWVHEGTLGKVIAPTSGEFLIIPQQRGGRALRDGGRKLQLKRSVAGQRANPWITNAANKVLARYGAQV